MNNPQEILKKYFSYSCFRPGQEQIIQNILNKKDTLAILPTGGGKSICYQIPALIFDYITIVISPLISLMLDQVEKLKNLNISAICINSNIPITEYNRIIQNLINYKYKIIYISPERLESLNFVNIIKKLKISFIAIDEAHCVSEWGHNFRKSYTKISHFINLFNPKPVIAAFTASATSIVKQDIIKIVNLKNPFIFTTTFDRKNLSFNVKSNINKIQYIYNFLEQNKNLKGIIYCNSKKNVDYLYDILLIKKYSVCKYHAGLSSYKRTFYQTNFINNKFDIMIATNAFGMGIDKPDIRYVIHYNMPKNIESYYQEARTCRKRRKSSKMHFII